IIQEILEAASRAPSGSNTQPWKVYVVQGKIRDEIVNEVCKVYDDLLELPELKSQYQAAYDYYPQEWFSPYIERRRENGWGLYGLLGIEKKDR
ncbi:MAG: nitroreductase family protein, partial [Neisseriaceae bacterium]|nr:nitroreductase family protein [Neisseriaceae bacterium]